MMNRFRIVVSIIFSVLLIASCDDSRVYEENLPVPMARWDQDEPLSFAIEITDTAESYNVYINIRNAGTYRYSNLFLFVNTFAPGDGVQRDTVELTLAADDGKWLGSGLGDLKSSSTLFKRDVRFPKSGVYRIELVQAMRINPLEGIHDAGLRLEKAPTGF